MNQGESQRTDHCPSCERYIEKADTCPYCGVESIGAPLLRRLRIGVLLLAIAGVAILILTAQQR